jgi:magnesium transporter
MSDKPKHFDEPILPYARKDFAALRRELTVGQVLESIRRQGLGEKVIYFYVVDNAERLVGVLPTRRLLTSALERSVEEIMVPRVVSCPHTATVLEACELFVMHRYLAFPVVDETSRLLGVVDVGVFTEEVFDIAEKEQADSIFETIGFRVAQVRDASPLQAFRFRFPWLLATIATGTACALLASGFAATLAQSLVLAFFLTMVLGLGESVSMQSMTVTIQALHFRKPTWRWYRSELRKELGTAGLLGAACGVVGGMIVWLWRGTGAPAVVIGGSIWLSLCAACVLGLSIPALLHTWKLDPKIAAGPLTLALADLSTLLIYLSVAAVAL